MFLDYKINEGKIVQLLHVTMACFKGLTNLDNKLTSSFQINKGVETRD